MSPPRPLSSLDSSHVLAKSIKGVHLSPSLGKAAAFRDSPPPARRGIKTTPKARLRHDDSQIQFATIESSPLQSEPLESQYLTARQKEVKERQGHEAAAMFPDIRSSPRSTSRPIDYNLPKLVLKSAQNSTPKTIINEDTSPTGLPALMNEFLGSSPTPSSKRSSDRRFDEDPPSSPPIIPSEFQIDQLTDAPLANADHGPVQERANAEEDPSNHFADKNVPTTKGYLPNDESNGAAETDPKPTNDQRDASNTKAPPITADPPPVSDFDIHVDAPSEPSLNKPSAEDGDAQTNDITHSFQSESSSRFSIEDDQVTAQLITEMERASSQQSAKQDEIEQSARRATKKRKRTADSPGAENKKRRTSTPLNPQAANNVPMMGETVADCVMIDVREADRSRVMLAPTIKREQSASPPLLPSIQVIGETAAAEKPPVDHPMEMTAIQSLRQERDAPVTAKKAIGRPRGSRNSQVKKEEVETERPISVRKGTRVSERLSGSTTSSSPNLPAASQDSTKGGPWLALGKTPGRGMFRWLQRSSADSQDLESSRPADSSGNEMVAEGISNDSKVQVPQREDLLPADRDLEHQSISNDKDHGMRASEGDGEAQAEGRGSDGTEEEAPTAQGILQRFHGMLDSIKRVTFRPEEERAVVGMLFECVKETHEAGRRHVSM